METLWIPFFNLSVLVGFLTYRLAAPTRDFIRLRRETLSETLQKVAIERLEAQKTFDEFTHKLKSVETELQTLREHAFQERQRSGNHIVEEARRLATQLVQDAAQASQVLYQELRRDLKRDLATQILNRVEKLLVERLTPETQAHYERNILNQFKKEAS